MRPGLGHVIVLDPRSLNECAVIELSNLLAMGTDHGGNSALAPNRLNMHLEFHGPAAATPQGQIAHRRHHGLFRHDQTLVRAFLNQPIDLAHPAGLW